MSGKQPVEVEAERFRGGRLLPRAFLWLGRRVVIRSWGRDWDEADGRHLLVMAESGRVFELVHRPGAWALVDRPTIFPPPSAAA